MGIEPTPSTTHSSFRPTRRELFTGGDGVLAGFITGIITEKKISEKPATETRGKLALEKLRGGYSNLESHASAVICDKQGNIIKQFILPDAKQRVNVHSAIKPFHAGLLIEFINELKIRGRDVPEFCPQEIAIFSASHSGSNDHRNWVRSALNKAQLDERFMVCGGRRPFDEDAINSLIRANVPRAQTPKLYDQCSGHHTCQGILSKLMNDSPENYWKPDGKMQQWFLSRLKEYSNDPKVEIISFDNCNIPTFNVSLPAFATLYAKFISNPSFKPVIDAMAQHPALVGDDTSLDSKLMELTDGNLIAKLGAEGLIIVVNKELQNTLVLKEWSGKYDFSSRIAIQALKEVGWINRNQTDTLFNMEDFSLRDDKYGVMYRFNSPLWV